MWPLCSASFWREIKPLWDSWVQSWTLCFDFHVQWAAVAKWIPRDNLFTVLVALSSSMCLVVFPLYAVNNLGLSSHSTTGNGFALRTDFYWKVERHIQDGLEGISQRWNKLGREITSSQLFCTRSIDPLPHSSSFRSNSESCDSVVLLSSVALLLIDSTARILSFIRIASTSHFVVTVCFVLLFVSWLIWFFSVQHHCILAAEFQAG